MRLTWYSNDPRLATGYGGQTAQVLRRMKLDGHDIAIASNAGTVRFMSEWEGIPVYPGTLTPHSTDMLEGVHTAHEGKVLFTLYDVWVLPDIAAPVVSWVPIDHDPVPPEVARHCAKPNVQPVAMSRFGQRALADAGINSVYIPHAVEKWYEPTPTDWRASVGIPGDAFVVLINAANRDTKDRKGFWPMFDALGRFQKAHPDAWVFLHSWPDPKMGGLDLRWWVRERDMDLARIRQVPMFPYLMGQIDDQWMAAAYTAADVLLSCSKGEGFGIPVIEAMACGTPAIVTDATAQPELVGDTGWRVRWEQEPDFAMGSTWARPDPDGILEALEEAYAERGTPKAAERSQAAQERARAEYDADTVYRDRWRPLLAQLEAPPKPERKAMSKAAKRRARKAA